MPKVMRDAIAMIAMQTTTSTSEKAKILLCGALVVGIGKSYSTAVGT
jgi:hypothetical protein